MHFDFHCCPTKRATLLTGLFALLLVCSISAFAQDLSSPNGFVCKVRSTILIHYENTPSSVNLAVMYHGQDDTTWEANGSMPISAGTSGDCPVIPTQASTDAWITPVDFTTHKPSGTPIGPFTFWWNDSVTFVCNSPTATASWKTDSSYQITWDANNATDYAPDFVQLTMNITPTSNPTTTLSKAISPMLVGTQLSYTCRVPHMPSGTGQIIIATKDGKARASGPKFAIRGADLAIVGHKKADIIQGGVPDTIRWTVTDANGAPSNSIDGPLKIEYWSYPYPNNSNKWATLDSLLPASTRSYVWTPPDPGTTNLPRATIRITADSGLIVSRTDTFRLKQAPSGIDVQGVPTAYSLEQNYPNPFSASADNSVTTIPFTLSSSMQTGVRVFDLLGRTVMQTPLQWFSEGSHTVPFNASTLMPGVYGYQLVGNGAPRVMMFVR